MKISDKNIIGIKTFIDNYLEVKKVPRRCRTHNSLEYFLFMSGYSVPRKVYFSEIDKNDILSGKILLVKDCCGKVIPYENPKMFNEKRLLEELNSAANRKMALNNRREYLKEQGLVETKNGDLVKQEYINEKEEEITEHVNRNKVLYNCDKKRYWRGC